MRSESMITGGSHNCTNSGKALKKTSSIQSPPGEERKPRIDEQIAWRGGYSSVRMAEIRDDRLNRLEAESAALIAKEEAERSAILQDGTVTDSPNFLDRIARNYSTTRKKYWEDNETNWSEKRRMEDQAISLGYAGCGQAPSLNLWPGPRSHTVPPPRGQYFNDGVSHGMIHRASKARRAYGLPSLVPPEPILPLSPPPKITDPNYTDHRDMDPASMDRFLIGSPDRGMWWLNNHVDKKYQKAPQYQALVARRLASIRTPKPKPVYY